MKKDINLYKVGDNLMACTNEKPNDNPDACKLVIASSIKLKGIPQISSSDCEEWVKRGCPSKAQTEYYESITGIKEATGLKLSPDGCIIIDWGDVDMSIMDDHLDEVKESKHDKEIKTPEQIFNDFVSLGAFPYKKSILKAMEIYANQFKNI